MKTVTTNHPEIGYTNNVEIIETALRERFGIDDGSHLPRAVAAHIWSEVCGQYGNERTWGSEQVTRALESCRIRLENMVNQLKEYGYA